MAVFWLCRAIFQKFRPFNPLFSKKSTPNAVTNRPKPLFPKKSTPTVVSIRPKPLFPVKEHPLPQKVPPSTSQKSVTAVFSRKLFSPLAPIVLRNRLWVIWPIPSRPTSPNFPILSPVFRHKKTDALRPSFLLRFYSAGWNAKI